jgi:hypothetical protein
MKWREVGNSGKEWDGVGYRKVWCGVRGEIMNKIGELCGGYGSSFYWKKKSMGYGTE